MDELEVLYRYKYRDFDPDNNNLKIITEGTLMFSSPLSFNDPFDSTPAFNLDSIHEIYKRRPDMIKNVGDRLKLSPAKRLMHKGRFIRNALKGVESGEFGQAFMSTVGALCLSRNPCNPLMWAHYAENHHGFLVEFRIAMDAPEQEIVSIMPHPVNYTTERPFIDWGSQPTDLEGYFFTKSSDWAYEEEERVLTTRGGPGLRRYSRKHFLHSVTAGVRISDDNFKILLDAVNKAAADTGKHIPLYRARLSPTSYKVFIPDHPDPRVSSPNVAFVSNLIDIESA